MRLQERAHCGGVITELRTGAVPTQVETGRGVNQRPSKINSKGVEMEALATLMPRQIDARSVEPDVEFDEVVRSLNGANQCPYTCNCWDGTMFCEGTGTGFE